jgi:hypothetical protein
VKANKKEFKEHKESEEYKERSEEKITPRRKDAKERGEK